MGNETRVTFGPTAVELTQVGELCSFDAFIKTYQIDDLGVSRLAINCARCRHVALGFDSAAGGPLRDFARVLVHLP